MNNAQIIRSLNAAALDIGIGPSSGIMDGDSSNNNRVGSAKETAEVVAYSFSSPDLNNEAVSFSAAGITGRGDDIGGK